MIRFLKNHRKTIIIGLVVGVMLAMISQCSMVAVSAATAKNKIVKIKLDSKNRPVVKVTVDRKVNVLIGKKNTDVEPVVQAKGTKDYMIQVPIAKGNSNTWVFVVKDFKTGKQLVAKTITWRNYVGLQSSCDRREPVLVVKTTKKSYGAFVKAKKDKATIYRTLILIESDGGEYAYGAIKLPKGYKVTGMAAQASGFKSIKCL